MENAANNQEIKQCHKQWQLLEPEINKLLDELQETYNIS
jgi:hypothetical protein